MIIELNDTTAAAISSAMIKARRSAGSPAMGMVLTMIVVTDQRGFSRAMEASQDAGREHPSRILVVVTGTSGRPGLDAELRIGDGTPGEMIVLRMSGPLADHPDSVVLPLLLPDTPVVVWWPGKSPLHPGEDPLGKLATRRITDAMGSPNPLRALRDRSANHSAGDSDLTWTRLTAWRALLAAALDQYPAHITAACVEAARDNAPANLMAAWLENRLDLPVRRKNSHGPGITAVRLTTAAGDISLVREDGLMAKFHVPGRPVRLVALKRRSINELISEELRRMDADEIFEQATAKLLERTQREPRKIHQRATGHTSPRPKPTKKSAKKAAKKAATKDSGTKKAASARPAGKRATGKRTAPPRTQGRTSTPRKQGSNE